MSSSYTHVGVSPGSIDNRAPKQTFDREYPDNFPIFVCIARQYHSVDLKPIAPMGPVRRTGAMALMDPVYCGDPDGNLIEVTKYR